ncbi:hypothetical protein MKW98_016621 [Papaver atlanticum]|uniref:Acidic protein n=1 Tax=Papaver atlanticum TaxID=357466 RepID=A0AAD4SR35_9MAGN|nr:hypothetical protein MKW98_016621 [Papaver atlanticum]
MKAGKCTGKAPLGTVIMSVLILGLFLAQASVEAKSCSCVRRTGARKLCAGDCGCLFTRPNRCPSSHPWARISDFQNTVEVGDEAEEQSNVVDGNKINEYCKLGCAFSVCENITTTQQSDEAVARCNDACFDLCNKNSNIAAITA